MEIRHYEQILGVVVADRAGAVEGRFGLLTTNSVDAASDLPGWMKPTTADMAKKARYVITWPVDNRQYPQFVGLPQISWSLYAGGFDQAANMPASVTLRGTNPANQESLTIPADTRSLAFKGGIFTVPSGCYVWNANLATPGSPVSVAYDSGNEGKLTYTATYDATTCVGHVHDYVSATGRLTVVIDE
jgi:hypothetical protein